MAYIAPVQSKAKQSKEAFYEGAWNSLYALEITQNKSYLYIKYIINQKFT